MNNYRDIKVQIPDDMIELSRLMSAYPNKSSWLRFPRLLNNLFEMGNSMIKSIEFKKIMEEESFDLVVVGIYYNDYLLGIGDYFNCPTIMLSVNGAITTTNDLTGNPLGVAVVRHEFLDTEVKTFIGSVKNFVVHSLDSIMMSTYLHYRQKQNYE